jgi:hypothetical protein
LRRTGTRPSAVEGRPSITHGPLDHRREPLRWPGLLDYGGHAEAAGLREQRRGLALTGGDHNRRVPVLRSLVERAQELHAVHVRHLGVEDDRVEGLPRGGEAGQCLEPFAASWSSSRGKASRVTFRISSESSTIRRRTKGSRKGDEEGSERCRDNYSGGPKASSR